MLHISDRVCVWQAGERSSVQPQTLSLLIREAALRSEVYPNEMKTEFWSRLSHSQKQVGTNNSVQEFVNEGYDKFSTDDIVVRGQELATNVAHFPLLDRKVFGKPKPEFKEGAHSCNLALCDDYNFISHVSIKLTTQGKQD